MKEEKREKEKEKKRKETNWSGFVCKYYKVLEKVDPFKKKMNKMK